MKQTILFITLLSISLFQLDTHAEESQEKSMDELSKEIANPLAQIWNLSLEHSRSRITGDLVDGHERINTTLFQPVLPIPLGDKYTAFARPVITAIDGPTSGTITGGTPTDPLGIGTDRSIEIGDTILPVGVGVAKALGWSWGAGATFIFPTSQNDLLGSHQYQAGPTALLLWANDDWIIGGHVQHWWGIADDNGSESDPIIKAAHDKDLNHTDLQYFIIRHLPNAWQVRASPHVTVDWEADSDNQLTFPVALGLGKMVKLGPMPVMLIAEYQYSVISPDDIGSESSVMVMANFIIKNPFGSM